AVLAIHTAFKNQQLVQLQDFFAKKTYKQMVVQVNSANWKELYEPDKFKCDFAQVPEPVWKIFFSLEFRTLVQQLTGTTLKKKPVCVLTSFGKGQYTLLHDKPQHTSGIWFGFELTQTWKNSWGGFSSITKKGKEIGRILPVRNSLTLVQLSKQTSMFVKYLNHSAKNKRVFLSGIV
ncbi:MAG: hypothetical protein Q7K43_06890, partial [Candidatus Woesearchaeota archaeon]|nr:hypothetical protein [Candidatus Woesearchaeota archaeon]